MKMITAIRSARLQSNCNLPGTICLAFVLLALPAVSLADTPTLDKGDTGWIMTCTVLVILMTIPGLALFYGGMVRSKNVLSVLMQVFVTFCLIALLWAIYGYSIAFTGGNAFFGGFDRLFMAGLTTESPAATFSKGVYIPEYVYFCFQLTFAAITPCLVVGAFAERVKFSALLVFMVIWFTFAYLPVAHMVWFWAGPDAYTDAAAAEVANATAGFLFQQGALDFAGGTVVHVNAGVAGLVGALVIGKRVGYGTAAMPPHNLPMVMIGASLLWVGWFGFNVGSNLEANSFAGLVFANTLLATAAATLAWVFIEWSTRGTPTMLGAASGAVAGLVAITPACGWVGPMGAICIGVAAGTVCLWACSGLKQLLGYDDSLDVFGVHCVGGIIGALMTGVFNSPALGGTGVLDYVTGETGFSMGSQVLSQFIGVTVTVVWSGVVAFIAFKLVELTIGLRVSEEKEREGLDTATHGERAYN
ncbi:MAG TPA: ammonium transporter [Steroidobacteraceae bacterium]|nr:ammonium transporter [Steroidobacteraceae bacterium]HRX88601.1 ammonium transporter [Steroidobacteraceae bacterium]